MPTLSQFKVLSSMLARLAHSNQQHEPQGNEQGGQDVTTEAQREVGALSRSAPNDTETNREHARNVRINTRVSSSPTNEKCELRDAQQEEASDLENIRKFVAEEYKDLFPPRGREGNGSMSPREESKMRIKSAKSVRIVSDKKEIVIPGVEISADEELERLRKINSGDISEVRGMSIRSPSAAAGQQEGDLCFSPRDDAKSPGPGGQGGSILKRGDSFIKRPDSRSKCVTFSRESSSVNVFGNITTQPDHTTRRDSTSEQTQPFGSRTLLITNSPGQFTSSSGLLANSSNHFADATGQFTSQRNKPGIHSRQPSKRPSSSGPVFHRASSPAAEYINRLTLQRKRSFHLEGAPDVKTAKESISLGLSLPMHDSFMVRRDSIVAKALPQSIFPKGEEKTDQRESSPFEAFVISNGRLLRRDSLTGRVSSARRNSSAGVLSRTDMSRRHSARSVQSEDEENQRRREAERSDVKPQGAVGGEEDSPQPEDTVRKSGNISDTDKGSRPGEVDVQSGVTPEPGRAGSATGQVDRVGSASSRWSSVRQEIVGQHSSRLLTHRQEQVQEEDIPEEFQAELQKLGFRKKQPKGKKKKSKQKAGTEMEKEGKPEKLVINLKEDPLLLKVSKKNRNVGKFKSKPEPRPFAVCFEVQGCPLCHNDVKVQLEKVVRSHPEVRIQSIQFHHRSLINSVKEMDNRWIIDADSVVGRNRLAGNNLNFGSFTVQLRRYDDIINSEYQQFVRMSNFVKMMNTRKILG